MCTPPPFDFILHAPESLRLNTSCIPIFNEKCKKNAGNRRLA
jgi:hypothetical protein